MGLYEQYQNMVKQAEEQATVTEVEEARVQVILEKTAEAEELIKQLNGRFIFVKGNHDRNNSLKTIIEKVVIKYGNHRINLVHNPEFVDYNYDLNFVAHVHNHWKFKRFRYGEKITDCINVGVDVNNFKPKTFEELYSEYRKWYKSLAT